MINIGKVPLTKTQVAALKECGDLRVNGWQQVSATQLFKSWYIVFRNPAKASKISVRITETSYEIWRDGVLKKIVSAVHLGLKN